MVGTDSAKAAHFIPTLPKVRVAILPLVIVAVSLYQTVFPLSLIFSFECTLVIVFVSFRVSH
jgi:hypothetical protein